MLRKIGHKLILAVSGVTVAALALFSYTVSNSHYRNTLDTVKDSTNQLSETIKSSTRYYMLHNDRKALHKVVDEIAKQEGIEKIRIFNKEGTIMFSSAREEMGHRVDMKAEACVVCHGVDRPLERIDSPERTRIFQDSDGVPKLGIINAIYNSPHCSDGGCHAHSRDQSVLGVLDITTSLAKVDRELKNARYMAFSTVLVMLAATAVVLSWLVYRLVGKPVSDLAKATEIVAAGDLGYRIPVDRHDEVGQLAQAFNHMTSQLSEAHRQIYQADRLASLGRLSAGVAHELNNPLTGILSYSSVLLRKQRENPEVKGDLEVIVRETKRCREIVKGLLDFSRRSPAQKEIVDVAAVIPLARQVVESQLTLQEISLVEEHAQDLPRVKADPGQLQQILINLLLNAIDAIGDRADGRIRIKTEKRGQGAECKVAISIGDNGCGISSDNMRKIFEPFFSTKGQKGTGLGLAVVWGIVEEHGGKVEVESREGAGTIFTILLPCQV